MKNNNEKELFQEMFGESYESAYERKYKKVYVCRECLLKNGGFKVCGKQYADYWGRQDYSNPIWYDKECQLCYYKGSCICVDLTSPYAK